MARSSDACGKSTAQTRRAGAGSRVRGGWWRSGGGRRVGSGGLGELRLQPARPVVAAAHRIVGAADDCERLGRGDLVLEHAFIFLLQIILTALDLLDDRV